MSSPSLIEAFEAAQERHTAAVADLVPLLIEMAFSTVSEVLPNATVLETEGEMNEDWLFTLRIQRVLDRESGVLYAIDAGHDDPEVETRIDEVGFEYHYNHHRPHRGIHQRAPNETADVVPIRPGHPIQRHSRCGGLINEYRTAA